MADADPVGRDLVSDWGARRREVMRGMARRMAAHGVAGTTDYAERPFANLASVYTDPARFAAEKRVLFGELPLVAGLSVDVPEPGDKLLFEDAGPPIVIVRGKDRKLRAFLNMCTHRGAKLVRDGDGPGEKGCGSSSRITCPFHAWTFDLQGKLVGLPGPAGFEGVDRASLGLIGVPCVEWHGLVFVVPKAGAPEPDIDAHLGRFAPEIAQLELGRAEPVKAGVIEAATNWKFALDTYGEGYHFSTLHASTIGQTHYNDVCVLDRFGPHHRVSFPSKDMARLHDLPDGQWPAMDYGGVHYLFPNTILFIGSIEPGKGFTQIFRHFPGDTPGRMRTRFAVYAPTGVLSDQHRAECEYAYDATAHVVSTEDYRISAEGYANIAHAPAGFRVLFGRNEPALQNVHHAIAAAIDMPLG